MARGAPSASERSSLEPAAAAAAAARPGLRVRFLDEEGNTERLVSADELDSSVARVKKVYFQKNRSSSETSLLLRHPSLPRRRPSAERRRSDPHADTLNNNSQSENLNNGIAILKFSELDREKTEPEQTKETNGHYKKNSNVYSVNQAKTLTAERKKSAPAVKAGGGRAGGGARSCLPAEGSLAEAAPGKDFTLRALGRLSRGLGRLLRRSNSVRISDPDPVYKVAYLGNVLTGWARGESCIEKPLATLWRNYQQSSKPDVVMKLSVTNSGLKGFTKEHGLTEYWAHRVTYCAAPPQQPRLLVWVYRHEGKKLKHELRCHAALCRTEAAARAAAADLAARLRTALSEFKKDRISKQNARLSLANSVYDNPSMPRRKILLSVGAANYRPPLERSKSAPKLQAIEELCSEEDEEEAAAGAGAGARGAGLGGSSGDLAGARDRRRPELSPRKLSCPEGIMDRAGGDTDHVLSMLVQESLQLREEAARAGAAGGAGGERLEAIDEAAELGAAGARCPYLLADSDDGSVSSGCETASTAASDGEPSLPPYPAGEAGGAGAAAGGEVTHEPLGEKSFRRRCTYPPPGDFESLLDQLTDLDSLGSQDGRYSPRGLTGDNESACSDESGYSEPLDARDQPVASTIMV
ncbi:uncharacterized protein LOC119691287 [Plutella xylostella]|uniref:uncharacterized protein LOC119691287 n=1 Tax=Plutella xylostella TaxID=51655 RepID=UPI0020327971|nr:uncharacterized protein LOC119691287 [Plutella xylostella]